ncbi:MAG: transcription termination factor NusA [Gemmataceae bacterium]
MNSAANLLRLVDQMQRDKNIRREVIFDGIESAIQLAALKHFGEESGVLVTIDRNTGAIEVVKDDEQIEPRVVGRIAAQAAKNVMIQKIREAESNSVFDEFTAKKWDLVTGTVTRHESGSAIVSLGRPEAILPRSEQIPGESYHVNDRIKAVILDVRKAGQRVKIVLSRQHPEFVRRLFEEEIPEIQERIIEIKAVAREAGHRTKIAVSSIDLKVDCVGACVGVRGSRIKNIVEELNSERIDIVRWNDSLQVMIPNALQPAQIEEVFLYPRPGRAVVVVKEDQLSLAIGRRGQNVRLASKLVGWDIEVMTIEEMEDSIEKAIQWFSAIPGTDEEMVEAFIEEGFMSYDDLSLNDGPELVMILRERLIELDSTLAEEIVAYAEYAAEQMERGIDVSLPPPGSEPEGAPNETAEEFAEPDSIAEEGLADAEPEAEQQAPTLEGEAIGEVDGLDESSEDAGDEEAQEEVLLDTETADEEPLGSEGNAEVSQDVVDSPAVPEHEELGEDPLENEVQPPEELSTEMDEEDDSLEPQEAPEPTNEVSDEEEVLTDEPTFVSPSNAEESHEPLPEAQESKVTDE